MKKKSFLRYLIVIFISILTFTSVGLSSFNVIKNNASVNVSNNLITSKDRAVCYNGTTKKKYKKIETALSDATSGQTVYVIPGKKITQNNITTTYPSIVSIDGNCTIASGVTLCLPYEGETYQDVGRTSTGDFADINEGDNLLTKLTIKAGFTLTNYGSIVIGGVLGRNGQAPTGMTVGAYCQITLESNAGINNYGSILSYGYIKESIANNGSYINNKVSSDNTKKGTIEVPTVIYDYRGGSYSSYAIGALLLFRSWKAMPFNVFDMPNIQSKTVFEYGTCLNGTITVYANDAISTSTASIIGPDSVTAMIKHSSGTIEYKYDTPKGYTYSDFSASTPENQINKMNFIVNGTFSISSMNVEMGVSINTADYHLPFSYKFNLIINSGTVSITNKVKLLAGSKIIIGDGSILNINAEAIAYQNYIPEITTAKANSVYYPNYNKSSTIINNGTININSKFGGVIQSSNEGGVINASSSFTNSMTTTEALTGETGGVSGTSETHSENARFTLLDKKIYNPNSDTEMLFSKATTLYNQDIITAGKNYTSHQIYNTNNYGWYSGESDISSYNYGIRYVSNSDTSSVTTSLVPISFDTDRGSVTINKNAFTNTDSSLTLSGLYYTNDFTVDPKPLNKDSEENYLLEPTAAINYLSGKNYITIYENWINPTSTVGVNVGTYNDQVLTYTKNKNVDVGETVSLSNFVSNKPSRNDYIVDQQYQDIFTFSHWRIYYKDSSSNEHIILDNISYENLSSTVFTIPDGSDGNIYIEPIFSSLRKYYVSLSDRAKHTTLGYAVTSITIAGNTIKCTTDWKGAQQQISVNDYYDFSSNNKIVITIRKRYDAVISSNDEGNILVTYTINGISGTKFTQDSFSSAKEFTITLSQDTLGPVIITVSH